MRRFFKLFSRGTIVLLFVFIAFWIWAMPKADTRGIWLTEGYGFAIKITPFTIDIREVSPISCERYQLAPANLWLVDQLGGLTFDRAGERLVIHSEEAINPITAIRADAMPPACSDPNLPDKNDPEYVYDVFWTAFDEHYSFFELHGVDWDAVRARIRPTITPDTTEDELFAALKDSIADLDDGHTYVNRITEGYSAAIGHPWDPQWDVFERVPDTRADAPLVEIPGTGIRYGLIDGHIGYVAIVHMDVKAAGTLSLAEHAQRAALELTTAMSGTDAIIVDIRFNGGGSDKTSMAYAGAFTDQRVLAFTKATRDGDHYTVPFESFVEPTFGTALSQPVYLLTSGMSASAAEIFTLAMRELPQVTIIGEPTAGFHSDIQSRELPNGWGLGMSHQIYTSADGEVFEGVGVPPDTVREMDGAAFQDGRDTLLEEVIGLIGN